MLNHLLGILASFCLFVSFILELFVMIGQLSNKPFLNILYFVQANNPQYNLSYGFGLWSYCQGPYRAPVQSCSQNNAAYNWAKTPGFDTMLPFYASSKNVERVFLTLFILYFIGLIISFLLWITTIFFCGFRKRVGSRIFDIIMLSITTLNFFIMFVSMVIAITLVVNTVKAVSGGSVYWSGHAGISLWFTIAAVVALFLATLCYLFKTCCMRTSDYDTDFIGGTTSGFGMSGGGRGVGKRIGPVTDRNHGYKNKPFDLTPHQPATFTPMATQSTPPPQLRQPQQHSAGIPQLQQQQQQQQYPYNNPQSTMNYKNTATMNQQQKQQDPHSISSLAQQYSPNLQPQYISPIYNDHTGVGNGSRQQ